MQLLVLGLFLWAFLLPPGHWAGEIVGGWEARPHSRPYMAYLPGGCGGFLVSENFVLTAAHCEADSITVVLGAHNIQQQESSQQRIHVRRQIPHPQYDMETLNNDIMLLELSHNATLTREVELLRLPTGHCRVCPETLCNVAGWGMTSLTTTTNTLREVNLSVVADDLCKKEYHNYFPSTMLCVGDSDNSLYRKSTYRGDSGGPLVCDGVAEGIVSKGKRNSAKSHVVFTRISHFVPWI
uniref:Peptidase S1 domain-containing protein n=1 Tax=Pelodiscus sinensis TaxID=13735 RepID=K7FM35_PELSI